MTDDDKLVLSALVDGELTGQELDEAIALINTSEQARQQFQHYQRTSNQLHGINTGLHQFDITSQLKQALADEQPHSLNAVTETKPQPVETPQQQAEVLTFPERFWKQTVGLAVAASFGALAVIGTMTQPETQVMPMNVSSQVLASNAEAEQKPNRWTVSEQEIEERLNVYLLDHNEYAGASNIFSNARVIAYESAR